MAFFSIPELCGVYLSFSMGRKAGPLCAWGLNEAWSDRPGQWGGLPSEGGAGPSLRDNGRRVSLACRCRRPRGNNMGEPAGRPPPSPHSPLGSRMTDSTSLSSVPNTPVKVVLVRSCSDILPSLIPIARAGSQRDRGGGAAGVIRGRVPAAPETAVRRMLDVTALLRAASLNRVALASIVVAAGEWGHVYIQPSQASTLWREARRRTGPGPACRRRRCLSTRTCQVLSARSCPPEHPSRGS